MIAHHEDMKRRNPGWKPGDTCDACGRPSAKDHQPRRRRSGSYVADGCLGGRRAMLDGWRRRRSSAGWDMPPEPDFPVVRIRAFDLRDGVIITRLPKGWAQPWPKKDGRWPVVVGDPEYIEHGEGGVPCVYWDTDELGPDNHYWCDADVLVTIAVESPRCGQKGAPR